MTTTTNTAPGLPDAFVRLFHAGAPAELACRIVRLDIVSLDIAASGVDFDLAFDILNGQP